MLIDYGRAVELLRKVVGIRGEDFLYQKVDGRCLYEQDGVASCGVGLALTLAGVATEDLALLDNLEDTAGSSGIKEFDTTSYLDYYSGVTFTVEGLAVFADFQNSQDLGVAYGVAVKGAEKI